MSERKIDRVSLYGARNQPPRPPDHEFYARHRGQHVRIWSDEHHAYWRPGGWGYTGDYAGAGIWPFEDAYAKTVHCGPEKRIYYELVLPKIDEVLIRVTAWDSGCLPGLLSREIALAERMPETRRTAEFDQYVRQLRDILRAVETARAEWVCRA